MPRCPTCHSRLQTIRHHEGIYYSCEDCAGRAVTIPQVRRVAGDVVASHFLRQINGNRTFGQRDCPFCQQRMREFHSASPPLTLDACKPCGAVWLDPAEFDHLPSATLPSPNELRLKSDEIIARHRVEQMRRKSDGLTGDEPDELWKVIPAHKQRASS